MTGYDLGVAVALIQATVEIWDRHDEGVPDALWEILAVLLERPVDSVRRAVEEAFGLRRNADGRKDRNSGEGVQRYAETALGKIEGVAFKTVRNRQNDPSIPSASDATEWIVRLVGDLDDDTWDAARGTIAQTFHSRISGLAADLGLETQDGGLKRYAVEDVARALTEIRNAVSA